MSILTPSKRTLLISTWSNAFNDSRNEKQTHASSYATYRMHGNLNPGHHLLYCVLRGGDITEAFTKRTNQHTLEKSGFQEYQGLAYAMYYLDEVMEAITIVEDYSIEDIRRESLQISERRKQYSNSSDDKKFCSYRHILRERLNRESSRVQIAQDKINRFIKPLRGIISNEDIRKAYCEIERQLKQHNIEIFFVKSPFYEYSDDY